MSISQQHCLSVSFIHSLSMRINSLDSTFSKCRHWCLGLQRYRFCKKVSLHFIIKFNELLWSIGQGSPLPHQTFASYGQLRKHTADHFHSTNALRPSLPNIFQTRHNFTPEKPPFSCHLLHSALRSSSNTKHYAFGRINLLESFQTEDQ